MVAVRMVSRGRRRPPAGGRRLRHQHRRRRCSSPRPSAASCGPGPGARPRRCSCRRCRRCSGYAAEMEVERDHVLGRDDHRRGRHLRRRAGPAGAGERRRRRLRRAAGVLSRRSARRRASTRCVYDGGDVRPRRRGARRVGGGDGLPRHPGPARARPGARAAPPPAALAAYRRAAAHDADAPREVSTHEQLAILRRELNGLVAAWHHRTGQAHGVTHAALRKELGGPAAAIANADQLHARINRLREWAAKPSR